MASNISKCLKKESLANDLCKMHNLIQKQTKNEGFAACCNLKK